MRRGLPVAALIAGILAAVAAARPVATPGVTSTSILIGGTAPISGESAAVSAVAQGAEAYFKYINARGGVYGRKINYRYLDDGSDPGRTANAVRQLVERDGAFAIFNSPGTSNNLAVRDYLNGRKVPQLFVASGFAGWGKEFRKYPFTIGFGPTYRAEATVYGRYLSSTNPRAKIAVLYQDDDDGKEMLNGLRRGLGPGAGNIVKAVAYTPIRPNVDVQIAELRQTKANVLMIFCFGKVEAQALGGANRLGWRPQIFVHAMGPNKGAVGAISAGFAKDPADPFWAKDPGNKLFQKVMKGAGLGSSRNLKNADYATGMASAFTLVDTLARAGKDPTRGGVVKTAARLNEANNPFLLPGIVVKTGPSDHFPIEQVQLQRWNGTRWVRFGGLVTAKS